MHPLQVLSLAAGIAIFLYVLLSYESEEKKLLEWIENTWADLSDAERRVDERIAQFMRAVAVAADQFLSKIYGTRILSLQALLTSAAICFFLTAYMAVPGDTPLYFALVLSAALLAAAVMLDCLRQVLYAGAIGAVVLHVPNFLAVVSELHAPVLLASAERDLGGVLARAIWSIIDWIYLLMFLAIPVAILLDFFSVAAIRLAYRHASKAVSARKAVALLCVGTVAAPVLVGAFYGSAVLLERTGNLSERSSLPLTLFVTFFSAPALLTSLVTVVLLQLLVTYRFVTALLPRAIYSTLKLKLLESRKQLLGLGGLFIGLAYPNLASLTEKFFRAIGG